MSNRDECIDWCQAAKEELGGNCCGSSVAFDAYFNTNQVYCVIFDVDKEEMFEYMPEEVNSDGAYFFSSFELGGMRETGLMEQA